MVKDYNPYDNSQFFERHPDWTAEDGFSVDDDVFDNKGRYEATVNKNGTVQSGFFGETIGHVSGNTIKASSSFLDAVDGYVKNGQVYKKGTWGDRYIGSTNGKDPAVALAHFRAKYIALRNQINNLRDRVNRATNKKDFLREIQSKMGETENADVIGNLNCLMDVLRDLKRQAENSTGNGKNDSSIIRIW